MIGGLILAWILTLFNVDEMFIEVLQPLFEITLTTSHWYVALGLVGLVADVLKYTGGN